MSHTLKNDPAQALEFLHKLRPAGPWWLVAIAPDQRDKPPQGHEFMPGDMESITSWIDGQGRLGRNIYYHINIAARPGNKAKATKGDVVGMAFCHVDLDPIKGRSVERERARLLDVVSNAVGHGLPEPTAIIDSGGGYQALWALEEHQHLDGGADLVAACEAHNRGIEQRLGGDHCHNIDRIFRLPGTVNYPDAKKREAGRVPTVARVVSADWARSYPIDLFPPVALDPGAGGSVGNLGTDCIEVTLPEDLDSLPRFDSGEEMVAAGLSPEGAALAVQGISQAREDSGEDTSSNSENVHAFCCEAARCGLKPEQTAGILLDRGFGISAGIYGRKNGRSLRGELERQIGRGLFVAQHAESIEVNRKSSVLEQLNDKHAFIRFFGGKTAILSMVKEASLDRSAWEPYTATSIKEMYCNQFVSVPHTDTAKPDKQVELGKWWLTNPDRRTYDTAEFAPRRDLGNNVFNYWTGFSVEPRAGDCSLYLDHLKQIVCRGDQECYDYLIGWMATCVQRPWHPARTAVVLRGKPGAGKGTAIQHFGKMWGRHFLHINSARSLTGNFNSHLRDTVVLFADEVFSDGNREHESVLKTLVTEETLQIEAKGYNQKTAPNYLHIMMSSNSSWAVPIDGHDRRFFVLDVDDSKACSAEYFAAINQQMESGGRAALLELLDGMDLSDFDIGKFPQTAARLEQIEHSLKPEMKWWLGKLTEGTLSPAGDTWGPVPRAELQQDWAEYMQRSPQGRHRTDVRCLGKFMASMMPRGYKDPRVRVGGVPSYTPVSLADCFDVLRENEPAIYATVAEHDPRNNPITEPSPAATGRRSSSSDARARAAAVRRDAGGLFDAGTAALHALRDGDYDLATALLEVEQQGDIF